jgi:hypothetical protein
MTTAALLEKLDDLRVELVELACVLDRRGKFDAADVAMTTSARVDELRAELNPKRNLSLVVERSVSG